MKKTVIVIHGGDTFETYEKYLSFLRNFVIDSLEYFRGASWKNTLQERLGDEYEVIAPRMPNQLNAQYEEWKIWFEKILPLLSDGVVLIGHSLGGIFLVKFLSENNFSKKIDSLHLVGAPFNDEIEYSLGDFRLGIDIKNIPNQVSNIFIYHSVDDSVVSFTEAKKYKDVYPKAVLVELNGRGHINQTEFPELIENIKNSLAHKESADSSIS